VPRLIPLALKAKTPRKYFFRAVSQLAIHYRGSPLAVDGPHPPRRGPRAGDRLPDAPIVRDGQPGALQAAVAAPGWHLLLCGPTDPAVFDDAAAISGSLVTTHRLAAPGWSRRPL
jgi:hypothetical protein